MPSETWRPLFSVLMYQSNYCNMLKDLWLKKGFFVPAEPFIFFFLSSQKAPSADALHFSFPVMVRRSALYLLGTGV